MNVHNANEWSMQDFLKSVEFNMSGMHLNGIERVLKVVAKKRQVKIPEWDQDRWNDPGPKAKEQEQEHGHGLQDLEDTPTETDTIVDAALDLLPDK